MGSLYSLHQSLSETTQEEKMGKQDHTFRNRNCGLTRLVKGEILSRGRKKLVLLELEYDEEFRLLFIIR